MNRFDGAGFPIAAGILFGLGLGGFFDGIVLHQVLQWHHMLTDAGYPATSVENLKINTFWDGLFHATTYVFVVMGLMVLWRASRRRHVRWSTKLLAGTLLIGFGLFNLVEGIVDHHLLGIHHVNETVPREQWIFWDVGFLTWGAAMLIGGWFLLKLGSVRPQKSRSRTCSACFPLITFGDLPDLATASTNSPAAADGQTSVEPTRSGKVHPTRSRLRDPAPRISTTLDSRNRQTLHFSPQ